jgi:hypothetical protein
VGLGFACLGKFKEGNVALGIDDMVGVSKADHSATEKETRLVDRLPGIIEHTFAEYDEIERTKAVRSKSLADGSGGTGIDTEDENT